MGLLLQRVGQGLVPHGPDHGSGEEGEEGSDSTTDPRPDPPASVSGAWIAQATAEPDDPARLEVLVRVSHGLRELDRARYLDGTGLLLEPSSHPAVGPFKEALVGVGIPATFFAVDDAPAVLDDTCGNLIQIRHHHSWLDPRPRPAGLAVRTGRGGDADPDADRGSPVVLVRRGRGVDIGRGAGLAATAASQPAWNVDRCYRRDRRALLRIQGTLTHS